MYVATRYATHQKVELKCKKLHSSEWSFFTSFLILYFLIISFKSRGSIMNKKHFYYINEQYFIDFPDPHLMQHKETIAGQAHDRPSFYAFEDSINGLSWMIPLSSQLNKYQHYTCSYQWHSRK